MAADSLGDIAHRADVYLPTGADVTLIHSSTYHGQQSWLQLCHGQSAVSIALHLWLAAPEEWMVRLPQA